MSVRVNKAKNFRNKAYVAADELDNLIQSMNFVYGETITSDAINATDTWKINFTTADSGTADTSSVDLTKIKDYIDNKTIQVTAGDGIQIDATNPLDPVIGTDIKIVKLGSATSGYAASYQLQIRDVSVADATAANAYTPVGDTIDIIKDQFLKGAEIIYGTFVDANTAPTGQGASDGVKHPILMLTFELTKAEGAGENDGTATNTDKVLYVDLNDLFDSYTAGNAAINSDALASNVITVVVDARDKVYTSSGDTGQTILTIDTNSGIKVNGIQKAINYAVLDEHAKASAAISGTNDKLIALGSATSAAVNALNVRISAVATNAQTGIQTVGTAVDTLDTQVSAAVSSLNVQIESGVDAVITNVNTALGTNITAINNKVTTAVTTVNTKVDSAVSNVNANVTSFKNTVSTVIDNLNTSVTNFKNTVSTTINNAQTAVEDFKNSTSTALNSAITNRSTQLTNAVQVNESQCTPSLVGNTGGLYQTTINAKYVLNVFAEGGDEIYPDIQRSTTAVDGKYTFTITADYGSAQETAEKWNVIYADALPTLTVTPMPTYTKGANSVAYTPVTNDVAYSDADDGTDASYTAVTPTNAVAVDVTDVTWADVTDVKATAVGQGTAATVPAVPDRTDKVAPNYTGYNA